MKFLKFWVRMLEIESREKRRRHGEPEVNINLNMECFLAQMKNANIGNGVPDVERNTAVVTEPASPPVSQPPASTLSSPVTPEDVTLCPPHEKLAQTTTCSTR